ncbi:MAG: hypothetical protein HYY23_07000 [Verrucomicrobia bacterium]|nr:hypothetical protein [Verrucomicrobiota bacterium]
MGLGHFIGLMPEEMLSRSIITGIEIDSITSRLAKALYPDADDRLATTTNDEEEEQSVTMKEAAMQTQHVRRSRGIRV